MIAMHRVWAIMLRHMQQYVRDVSRLVNTFYWPVLDILLMGYLGIWTQGADDQSHIAIALLASIILWNVIIRANFDISWNALEELWSANMVNLFASPLTLTEWMLGSIGLSIIMLFIILFYLGAMAMVWYGFNIFALGCLLMPIVINLFIAGLTIGFFSSGLLFYGGKRIEGIVFMIGWVFAPVSGAYYPIDVMPDWVQCIARVLPMTYCFDALRSLIKIGFYDQRTLMIGSLLNGCYFMVMLLFFKLMFEKSREKGLARLMS